MALVKGRNAYADVADADAYNGDHPFGEAWEAFTPAQKAARLILATRLLDENFEWEGVASQLKQPLSWPRLGLLTRQLAVLRSETIPELIRDATCEFARVLAEDTTADNVIEDLKVRSVTGAAFGAVVRKVVPSSVVDIIPVEWYSSVRGHTEFDSMQLRRR